MGLNRKTGRQKFGKKEFTRKPYDKYLYKWSPDNTNLKSDIANFGARVPFCDAKPFSNGEDFIVTYVYEKIVINGVEHRYAYVACDYVE